MRLLWLALILTGLGLLGYALWRLLGREHDSAGGDLNRSGPPGESFGKNTS